MKAQMRYTARRQLQQKLAFLIQKTPQQPPSKGWVRALREALGMSTYQFAKRLGLSQSATLYIEQREAKKTITLATLEKAARGLNCRLEYFLVPLQPLEETLQERARRLAIKRLKRVASTMELEDQSVTQQDMTQHLEKMILDIVNKNDPELWDNLND